MKHISTFFSFNIIRVGDISLIFIQLKVLTLRVINLTQQDECNTVLARWTNSLTKKYVVFSYNVDYDLGTILSKTLKCNAFFSFRAACFSKDAEWANNPAMWRVDQSMPQIQSATKKRNRIVFH